MAYISEKTGREVDELLDKVEKGDFDITIDTELSSESTNAIANSAVANAISELPTKRGYYPSMSVGMADNLVGRGDVQDAQINFRPSAGADNISDATARIERIKGNSVVWNQQFPNFEDVSGGYHYDVYEQDGNLVVSSKREASPSNMTIAMGNFVQGHKYLVYAKYTASIDIDAIYLYNGGYNVQNGSSIKIISGVSQVFSCAVEGASNIWFLGQSTDTVPLGTITTVHNWLLIDLTKMFGVGNEPTTVEEYYQRKPMNIEDEFAYNEGELIDMKVDTLISTSDNAYDYVKGYARVMGGHTYDCSYGTAFVEKVYFSTDKDNIVAQENAMTSDNGKYTFPSDGYAVPYTTDGDVREYCVCLQHTYTKPHPPYQQEVKDLSFIGKAFQEGVRSVGSVCDEIRFNPTKKVWEKVTRIGVATNLTFISGGGNLFATSISDMKLPAIPTDRNKGVFSNKYVSSKSTSTSTQDDKSILRFAQKNNIYIKDTSYTSTTEFNENNQDLIIYYELAEPIVEEIDLSPNFNLDYFAWDFGTEEAIASVPSAPFRADINYEPNAVDDLRWAISEIRSLRAELAQLQSEQASETNLTE